MHRHIAAVLAAATLAVTTTADDWPQFRGPQRDGISRETGLYREWPADGPKVLWTLEVCQGYAAPAITGGKVYFNDYSEEKHEWYVRCVNLSDGAEQWRYVDKKRIRPNHSITRTVPAVDENYVFSLDPKSILHCLRKETGEELWQKNFVREYGSKNPPWYNGQCPLLDGEKLIAAPGGGEALIVAFDKETGNEIWRTPNPDKWPMAHSSLTVAELCGVKQYLWTTLMGVVGAAADDGRILWTLPWKFNIAVAPSPVPVDDQRVFATSGYDADSVMVKVTREGEAFKAEAAFSFTSEHWNSECHTPIVWQDHLFAVGKKKRGLFTCLDFNGEIVWSSRGHSSYGLGSYLLADGMFYVLEGDTGMLRLLEANTTECKQLGQAQLLHGHDVWAPLALSDGRLIIRDMTKMVCVEVGPTAAAKAGE